MTKYVRHGEPIEYFRKKKIWDGVTGTIFNMPSKPIDEGACSEDERVAEIRGMLADEFRTPRGQLPDERANVFPLDIRRVRRADAPRPEVPSLDGKEEFFELPWLNAATSSQTLSEDDPWWVTQEQEHLRDNPQRKYPPKELREPTEEDQLILPVEDDAWEEELKADDYGYYKYFATNLHGGTLIINGIEVRKGHIAGPLPAFAVIETPGSQFSFWWGSSGRNNGGKDVFDPNLRRKWENYRQRYAGDGDEWRFIGLLAGQVWDYKIRDRVRRELQGHTYDDDPIWDGYKKAVPAAEPPPEVPYTGKLLSEPSRKLLLISLLCS